MGDTKKANIYVTATLNNFALIVQQATDLQSDPAEADRYLEDFDPLGRLAAVVISDGLRKRAWAISYRC